MKYKIPLTKPIITKEMIEAAINALQNEKLVMGESVYKFEEEFAKYIGVKNAISVNSGTSALYLIAEILKINKKDEVIAPSATFISTINGFVKYGATPVFADINLKTYTIDIKEISRKIGNKTKAIIPVHLYGYPVDMDPLLDQAKEKEIIIVEDAAQAHGAEYKNRKVGSLGNLAIFSFYPTKNMTVGGDGGIITTNDDQQAEILRKLRDVGRRGKYSHDLIGYTLRLNTVNAAIGRVQLKYLETWNEKRRQIAAQYDKLLSDLDNIITPPKPTKDFKPVYHLYVIRVPEKHRNILGAWLGENRIESLVHYPIPVHLQPAYSHLSLDYKLPNTEKWAKSILSIPMYPELENDQVKYVSEKIHEFYEKRIYLKKEWIIKGEEWIKKLT